MLNNEANYIEKCNKQSGVWFNKIRFLQQLLSNETASTMNIGTRRNTTCSTKNAAVLIMHAFMRIDKFNAVRNSHANRKSSRDLIIQSVNQSINQSKPVMPRHRWGTLADSSIVTAAHRRLSFATQSNDNIDWLVHSSTLSFQDLRGLPWRRLPSAEPCNTIFVQLSHP